MSSGWNLNQRLVALHNMDLPLVSGDLIQRFGRILRQGNYLYESGKIEHVEIVTYTTERTLDSWFCSLLERKIAFIKQFNLANLNGEVREYEPESEIISFAELSALTSGDQRMLDRIKAQHEYKKLAIMHRAYKKRTYHLEGNINYYENRITDIKNNMSTIITEQQAANNVVVDAWLAPDGSPINIQSLTEKVVQFRNMYSSSYKKATLAVNRGYELFIERDNYSYETHIVLKGQSEYVIDIKASAQSRAILNAASSRLLALRNAQEEANEKLDHYKSYLAQAKIETKKSFKHADRMKELQETIRKLDLELAA